MPEKTTGKGQATADTHIESVEQITELDLEGEDVHQKEEQLPDEQELLNREIEKLKKQIAEDERNDSIFRSGHNLTEKFDNRPYLHPHGMLDFDPHILKPENIPKLEKLKFQTRVENYRYLGVHYELDAMMAIFFRKLLRDKPQDTVTYAAEFFTKDINSLEFPEMLDYEKIKMSDYRVNKMCADGKITMDMDDAAGQSSSEQKPKLYWRCFKRRRDMKCQNIPFNDSTPNTQSGRPRLSEMEKSKKPYCGCKDWKVGKTDPPPLN